MAQTQSVFVNRSKMSYLGTAVNYFSSRINRKTVNQKWPAFKGWSSAFYFFDLQQGCKLIAVFEVAVSFVRICWIYYLVYRSDIKTLFPVPVWLLFRKFLYYHHTHYHFVVGLHLITIFNSMLLFMGTKRANVVLLYYWMYVSLFTGNMTYLNNIFNNFRLSQAFYTIPSMMLQYYCFVIVISLIWKIREMPKSNAVEMEEPLTEVED